MPPSWVFALIGFLLCAGFVGIYVWATWNVPRAWIRRWAKVALLATCAGLGFFGSLTLGLYF
jgi:hypothetical protein